MAGSVEILAAGFCRANLPTSVCECPAHVKIYHSDVQNDMLAGNSPSPPAPPKKSKISKNSACTVTS